MESQPGESSGNVFDEPRAAGLRGNAGAGVLGGDGEGGVGDGLRRGCGALVHNDTIYGNMTVRTALYEKNWGTSRQPKKKDVYLSYSNPNEQGFTSNMTYR